MSAPATASPGLSRGGPDDRPSILDDLESGRLRAARPDPAAPDGWRIEPGVKDAILACFRLPALATWHAGPLGFSDRAAVPPKDLVASEDATAATAAGRPWRIVPGGTSIRSGAHLEPGVIVMPPSFVNVGAWIGAGTMVDSHVLVGSCAQVGAGVHLAAGTIIGGVLEPAGARPVIVEDDAFIGGGCGLYEGVLVGRGAVLGAGVVLTGTSRLYDAVREVVLEGTRETPLVIPAGAVVVPGTRAVATGFGRDHGLGLATAVLVKDRDARTDARAALEGALR